MHHAAITQIESPGPVAIASKWRMVFIGCAVVGLLAFAGGLASNPARAWHIYLVNYFLFLGFALFGVFYAALNHAINSTWSIVTRRVAEGFAAYLPVAFILFVVLIFGTSNLYEWATRHDLGDPSKYRYLSVPWFAVRGIVFFLLWSLFAWKIVGLFSLKQDESGDPQLSRKMLYWSIGFIPVFAGTFALSSYDLLMSLEHKWYSTMFSVYCFAGLLQSGLALLTIVVITLRRQGSLANATTSSHLKDLGTLVFAFTIFMTYIGFSQWMLIWYANLPEETFFFIHRQQGGWEIPFVLLVILKFGIPFFGLLSQTLKKSENWLYAVCWVVIAGQFVDLYLIVMPTLRGTLVPIGWIEIGTFLGFAGLFGLAVSRFYGRNSVLAARDPRVLVSANWRFWE